MTTPTTTHPVADGAWDRARSHARFEAHTLLANGEQLVVSIVLPAIALVALAMSTSPSLGPGGRIDVATPGVLALAIVSTAFTGQAIATGFDRRYGVLRLLGASPLGRSGLLAGKSVAVLTVVVVQTVVLTAIALGFGWRPALSGIPIAIVVGLVGCWTWVSLAMLIAGTLRAEAVLAVANLIWVLLAAVGGLIFPPDRMPSGLATVVRLLPSGALGDALRDSLLGHDRSLVVPLLVLVIWGAVATLISARTFKWSD